MGRFDDYEKVADPLVLPINGKDYTIPAVGMQDGIRLSTQEDPDAAEIQNDEFRSMLLGAVYEQMVADNVPADAVMRAVTTAYADFTRGRDFAQMVWATGGDPKAVERYLKPNRASRRSTGTASARKTPSRASTNATKASPGR